MKRTLICGVNIDETRSFWTNGQVGGLLKQNKRILFSRIDLLNELSGITEDKEELLGYYDNMDFYFVLICLIDLFGDNIAQLNIALQLAINRYEEGQFVCTEINEGERNVFYQNLLNSIISDTNNNVAVSNIESEDLYSLTVSLLVTNIYINPLTGVETLQPSMESGIFGDENYAEELKKQGIYYFYAQSDAKLFLDAKEARLKRIGQRNIINRLKSVNPTFRGEVADNLINSGIIAKSGTTPNNLTNLLRSGDSSKIGEPITIGVIIGWCVAILSAAAVVWKAYVDKKRAAVERDTAEILSANNYKKNCAGSNDFFSVDTNGDGVVDANERNNFFKKICLFGIGFVILYQIL